MTLVATLLPHAVLMDMDGTLVDTERLWWTATVDIAAQVGVGLAAIATEQVIGQAVDHTAAHLAERSPEPVSAVDLAAALEGRFLELIGTELVILPGALGLLSRLREHGIATALISASSRPVMDLVLATLGRQWFDVSFAAGETARTKPEPDPYLAGLTALGLTAPGLTADQCLAVEDSATGLASAEAAGLAVLIVPSPVTHAPAPGRTFVDSLLDMDLACLARALTNRR